MSDNRYWRRLNALLEPKDEAEIESDDLDIVYTAGSGRPQSQRMIAIERDAEFQRRMREAIAAGLENPPTSVNTAPCTRAPIYITAAKAALIRERLQDETAG